MVKAFYTEKFNKVIECCPVPVILAGGPKGSEIVDIARDALNHGAKGLAFGRNIFQSTNPRNIIEELGGLFT